MAQDASVERDTAGRFRAGSVPNPQGRPRGSRNRMTAEMETLLARKAEPLIEKAIAMALEGNPVALRLCVERLMPRRERTMGLNLRCAPSAEGLATAFNSITDALTAGELTASETKSAALLLEAARRAFETCELAHRVDELEERLEDASSQERG